jgi:hypothetical protein
MINEPAAIPIKRSEVEALSRRCWQARAAAWEKLAAGDLFNFGALK